MGAENRVTRPAAAGFVSLVGAGPGDPGLLTVRGAAALAAADVVVYDYLANPALLARVPPAAERVYVGKKAGAHTLPQAEINALLVEHALAGRRVVRLKGGDPFVFGRGGEEALALAEAGVPFEIIPGVSSAVAAPAYAGIPVTHRGLATSLAIVAGHEDPGKAEPAVDWSRLAAGADTMVVLMGVGQLPRLVDELIRAGRPAGTPVALVSWGSLPRQRTVAGTLADIVGRVEAAGLKPPAVTVVGPVVGLRERLQWFESRPLFGQRVLVTRSREQAGTLAARLEALGAEAVELPAVQLVPPDDWAPLDRAIAGLAACDWVVFTSANGVRYFWQRLAAAGRDTRALGGCRLAAIGPATAAELEARGVRPDLVPGEYVAEAVAEALLAAGVDGCRVLLPQADLARPLLAERLRAAGALVDEVVAYCTVRPPADPEALAGLLEGITIATFASSSTVRHLAYMAREAGLDLAAALARRGAAVACIGPITARTAREIGLPVHVVAETYTVDGLVAAVVEYVRVQPSRSSETCQVSENLTGHGEPDRS